MEYYLSAPAVIKHSASIVLEMRETLIIASQL